MTTDKRTKRDVRARQQHTGEHYVVARRRNARDEPGDTDRVAHAGDRTTLQIGDQVWLRKPGATTTAEDLPAAMTQIETWQQTRPAHDLVRWNP